MPSYRCETETLKDGPAAGREIVWLRDGDAGIEVGAAPFSGGEVASLRVRHDGEWVETLHRALDFGVIDGWDGRAPALFPQVGRCWAPSTRPPTPVPDGTPCGWEMDGKLYPLECHGFARKAVWEVVETGADGASAWVTCAMGAGAATREVYPFGFRLAVTHRVTDGAVVSLYELTAGENGRPMPFTIGNHISLKAPFTDAGSFGEVRLTTPCGWWEPLVDNIPTGERRPFDMSEGRPLSDSSVSNNILAGYAPGEAWAVMDDPAAFAMRVSQNEPTGLFAPEDVFFVFWGEEDLGYFCPEPWLGVPDALNTDRRLARLEPGATFRWEMRVAPEGRN